MLRTAYPSKVTAGGNQAAALCLRPHGALTADNAAALLDATRYIPANASRRLLVRIDLRYVWKIDPGAIAVFKSLHDSLRRRGYGGVRITSPLPAILRICREAGLGHLLELPTDRPTRRRRRAAGGSSGHTHVCLGEAFNAADRAMRRVERQWAAQCATTIDRAARFD